MELPNVEVRRALVASYALVAQRLDLLNGSRPAPAPTVLPTAQFFPDVFTGDEASVQRLVDRLLTHAGLADMAVVARFWDDAEAAACGTGACGSCGPAQAEPESVPRLIDAGDFWQVNVLPAEARQSVVLTSALCRAIALAVLREADDPPTAVPADLAVDLAAVGLGFGVLLLEGSHIYRKSCGGPSIGRTTALGPSELSLVLALATAVSGQPLRALSKHLSITQREAFAEARVWADSNPELVRALRHTPELVSQGGFELREPSSWLGRWLGKASSKERRAATPETATTIEELEAALQSSPLPRLPAKAHDAKFEEIRRLVDEALSE